MNIPKSDPLVRAIKKAVRESSVCKLDKLLAEEARWNRKHTIAQNKLAAARKRINKYAMDLALEGIKPRGDKL